MTSLEGWSSAIELRLQMMADLTRIELAIFSVTGRHVSHYTTDPLAIAYLLSHNILVKSRKFYAFFIGAHFLQCVQPCIYGRILHRRCRRPAEKASVPPLSASSGTLAGAFLKKERRLAASFTVEAALVLGLVFMVMGMTIKEAYTIHDEITGSMILEEALERASYNRDEKKEDTYFTGQAEEQGNPRLWLGKYSARLKRKTGKISGYASAGAWALEIERGAFRPELFLRRTAALTEMGNGQDDGGSGVQTGNEPELYGPEAGTGKK